MINAFSVFIISVSNQLSIDVGIVLILQAPHLKLNGLVNPGFGDFHLASEKHTSIDVGQTMIFPYTLVINLHYRPGAVVKAWLSGLLNKGQPQDAVGVMSSYEYKLIFISSSPHKNLHGQCFGLFLFPFPQ